MRTFKANNEINTGVTQCVHHLPLPSKQVQKSRVGDSAVEHFPEFAKPFFQIHVCATTQARNCSVMRLFLNKQNKQLGSLYNSLASQGNEGKQSRSYRKIVPIKFFSPNARMYRKSLSFIVSLRNSARKNKKFNLF